MKTRNYGIDFLRMISMIMIVMLHTLGHGGILRSVSFLFGTLSDCVAAGSDCLRCCKYLRYDIRICQC